MADKIRTNFTVLAACAFIALTIATCFALTALHSSWAVDGEKCDSTNENGCFDFDIKGEVDIHTSSSDTSYSEYLKDNLRVELWAFSSLEETKVIDYANKKIELGPKTSVPKRIGSGTKVISDIAVKSCKIESNRFGIDNDNVVNCNYEINGKGITADLSKLDGNASGYLFTVKVVSLPYEDTYKHGFYDTWPRSGYYGLIYLGNGAYTVGDNSYSNKAKDYGSVYVDPMYEDTTEFQSGDEICNPMRNNGQSLETPNPNLGKLLEKTDLTDDFVSLYNNSSGIEFDNTTVPNEDNYKGCDAPNRLQVNGIYMPKKDKKASGTVSTSNSNYSKFYEIIRNTNDKIAFSALASSKDNLKMENYWTQNTEDEYTDLKGKFFTDVRSNFNYLPILEIQNPRKEYHNSDEVSFSRDKNSNVTGNISLGCTYPNPDKPDKPDKRYDPNEQLSLSLPYTLIKKGDSPPYYNTSIKIPDTKNIFEKYDITCNEYSVNTNTTPNQTIMQPIKTFTINVTKASFPQDTKAFLNNSTRQNDGWHVGDTIAISTPNENVPKGTYIKSFEICTKPISKVDEETGNILDRRKEYCEPGEKGDNNWTVKISEIFYDKGPFLMYPHVVYSAPGYKDKEFKDDASFFFDGATDFPIVQKGKLTGSEKRALTVNFNPKDFAVGECVTASVNYPIFHGAEYKILDDSTYIKWSIYAPEDGFFFGYDDYREAIEEEDFDYCIAGSYLSVKFNPSVVNKTIKLELTATTHNDAWEDFTITTNPETIQPGEYPTPDKIQLFTNEKKNPADVNQNYTNFKVGDKLKVVGIDSTWDATCEWVTDSTLYTNGDADPTKEYARIVTKNCAEEFTLTPDDSDKYLYLKVTLKHDGYEDFTKQLISDIPDNLTDSCKFYEFSDYNERSNCKSKFYKVGLGYLNDDDFAVQLEKMQNEDKEIAYLDDVVEVSYSSPSSVNVEQVKFEWMISGSSSFTGGNKIDCAKGDNSYVYLANFEGPNIENHNTHNIKEDYLDYHENVSCFIKSNVIFSASGYHDSAKITTNIIPIKLRKALALSKDFKLSGTAMVGGTLTPAGFPAYSQWRKTNCEVIINGELLTKYNPDYTCGPGESSIFEVTPDMAGKSVKIHYTAEPLTKGCTAEQGTEDYSKCPVDPGTEHLDWTSPELKINKGDAINFYPTIESFTGQVEASRMAYARHSVTPQDGESVSYKWTLIDGNDSAILCTSGPENDCSSLLVPEDAVGKKLQVEVTYRRNGYEDSVGTSIEYDVHIRTEKSIHDVDVELGVHRGEKMVTSADARIDERVFAVGVPDPTDGFTVDNYYWCQTSACTAPYLIDPSSAQDSFVVTDSIYDKLSTAQTQSPESPTLFLKVVYHKTFPQGVNIEKTAQIQIVSLDPIDFSPHIQLDTDSPRVNHTLGLSGLPYSYTGWTVSDNDIEWRAHSGGTDSQVGIGYTHLLTPDELGKTIYAKVTARRGNNSSVAETEKTELVENAKFTDLNLQLTGNGHPFEWHTVTGLPYFEHDDDFVCQWEIGGEAITGADRISGCSFKTDASDSGRTLKVSVTLKRTGFDDYHIDLEKLITNYSKIDFKPSATGTIKVGEHIFVAGYPNGAQIDMCRYDIIKQKGNDLLYSHEFTNRCDALLLLPEWANAHLKVTVRASRSGYNATEIVSDSYSISKGDTQFNPVLLEDSHAEVGTFLRVSGTPDLGMNPNNSIIYEFHSVPTNKPEATPEVLQNSSSNSYRIKVSDTDTQIYAVVTVKFTGMNDISKKTDTKTVQKGNIGYNSLECSTTGQTVGALVYACNIPDVFGVNDSDITRTWSRTRMNPSTNESTTTQISHQNSDSYTFTPEDVDSTISTTISINSPGYLPFSTTWTTDDFTVQKGATIQFEPTIVSLEENATFRVGDLLEIESVPKYGWSVQSVQFYRCESEETDSCSDPYKQEDSKTLYYRPVPDDLDHFLKAKVTLEKPGYETSVAETAISESPISKGVHPSYSAKIQGIPHIFEGEGSESEVLRAVIYPTPDESATHSCVWSRYDTADPDATGSIFSPGDNDSEYKLTDEDNAKFIGISCTVQIIGFENIPAFESPRVGPVSDSNPPEFTPKIVPDGDTDSEVFRVGYKLIVNGLPDVGNSGWKASSIRWYMSASTDDNGEYLGSGADFTVPQKAFDRDVYVSVVATNQSGSSGESQKSASVHITSGSYSLSGARIFINKDNDPPTIYDEVKLINYESSSPIENAVYSFKWFRCFSDCEIIEGETSDTYSLRRKDLIEEPTSGDEFDLEKSATLKAEISFSALGYDSTTFETPQTGHVKQAKAPSLQPVITGTFQVGGNITIEGGAIDNPGPSYDDDGNVNPTDELLEYQKNAYTSAYYWYCDIVDRDHLLTNGGAVDQSNYQLQPNDAGCSIIVVIELGNQTIDYESSTWTSNPSPKVMYGDDIFEEPTLDDEIRVGSPATVTGFEPKEDNIIEDLEHTFDFYVDTDLVQTGSNNTYIPYPEDAGKTLRVTVTTSAPGYQTITRQTESRVIGLGQAPVSFTPVIHAVNDEAVRVGDTLVITGLPDGWIPTFQWHKVQDEIDSVVGDDESYTVAAQDLGAQFYVEVSATHAGFLPIEPKSSTLTEVVDLGAAVDINPSILGEAKVGELLTIAGSVDKNSGWKTTYQWLRNGLEISNPSARSDSYIVHPEDLGSSLSVQVQATQPGFLPTSLITSPPTEQVVLGAATDIFPEFDYSGPLETGTHINLVNLPTKASDLDESLSTPELEYSWFSITDTGEITTVSNQNNYIVTPDDVGNFIGVQVALKRDGYADSQANILTDKVVSLASAPLFDLSITGNPQVGQILHLNALPDVSTGWVLDSLNWICTKDSSIIILPNETSDYYALTALDYGCEISVLVRLTKPGFEPILLETAKTEAVRKGDALKYWPRISGEARVGRTLWATGSPAISAELSNYLNITYQWLINGHEIENATSKNYTVQAWDMTQNISVRIQTNPDNSSQIEPSSFESDSLTVMPGSTINFKPSILEQQVNGVQIFSVEGVPDISTGWQIAYNWTVNGQQAGDNQPYLRKDDDVFGEHLSKSTVLLKIVVSKPGYQSGYKEVVP
ncbi:MAG: hypothetical protein LBI63_04265 [Candidatus Ancillula sp.]|nr:hypothetical protein [Candidatus Ancillula sp.]